MVDRMEAGTICALNGCRPDGNRGWAMTKQGDIVCSECVWLALEPALKASVWRGKPGTTLRSPITEGMPRV